MSDAGLVTVFGGSGFIGRYVVRRLARRGARVRVAIRRPDDGLLLRPYGGVGQIDLFQANLRDDASVARAVDGADRVVNLVGILYEGGNQTFDAVQADGAGRVAQAAAKAGVGALVHVSAIGADSQSEADYARAKADGEEQVRAAFPAATILRPSAVFGAEDQFLNRFARMALTSLALPLIAGGQTKLQPVFVDDVAAAVEAALYDPVHVGKTYELGGPKVMTLEEIMRFVLDTIGRKRLLLPMPAAVAKIIGGVMQLLPVPPLTIDQVRLLETDNVASGPGLAELGIQATPMEAVADGYLSRFRRFGAKAATRFG